MNILLDTHVLIWALENNPTLSESARSNIIMGKNMVFVSSVSIWENFKFPKICRKKLSHIGSPPLISPMTMLNLQLSCPLSIKILLIAC